MREDEINLMTSLLCMFYKALKLLAVEDTEVVFRVKSLRIMFSTITEM